MSVRGERERERIYFSPNVAFIAFPFSFRRVFRTNPSENRLVGIYVKTQGNYGPRRSVTRTRSENFTESRVTFIPLNIHFSRIRPCLTSIRMRVIIITTRSCRDTVRNITALASIPPGVSSTASFN